MAKTLTRITESDVRTAAGAIIFERGAQYFESGAVRNVILLSKIEASAKVRGSQVYRTTLKLNEDGDLGCTCS
jgi:uncharacterized Zn finger protein